MVFNFSIEGCFSSAIGRNGIDFPRYAFFLSQARYAADQLRMRYDDKRLPLLSVVHQYDDLDSCLEMAHTLRHSYTDIVLLGTGGSTLNPQALVGLKPHSTAPRLHFLDNIDPHTTQSLLQSLPIESTCFLVISKSGGTLETVSQTLVCMEYCRSVNADYDMAAHFVFITEPRSSIINQIATTMRARILPHHTGVGGRFSSFTNVALLPAAIVGLDVKKFLKGARDILDYFLQGDKDTFLPSLCSAAIHIALIQQGFCSTVRLSYVDRLMPFLSWQRQVWCESLGKDGVGTLYVPAQGTLDQHSQLQLYLEGKHDKSFTVFMLDQDHDILPLKPRSLVLEKAPYLKDRSLGQIMTAEQESTVQTLASHGCPLITIRMPRLDEEVLGALFMHSFLEVIVIASLLGVNAFNQPAVEEGKILARQFLGEM